MSPKPTTTTETLASSTSVPQYVASPPTQSRDATMPSRFFPATPSSPGNILVPSSSPPRQDQAIRSQTTPWENDTVGDGIPGLIHSNSRLNTAPTRFDPLSAPSGFMANNGVPHASITRPSGSNSRRRSESEERDGEPPRKRINRGESSKDPLDLFSVPDSPDVQRPGQRRMFNGAATGSPVPSDDSASDLKNGIAGPSKPRILRGTRSPPPPQTTPEQSQSETDDAKYTHFRFTQPQFTTEEVRAAWTQAGGDVRKASDLLNDPNWKPPSSSPSSHVAQKSRPQEVGRVKEIDDAKQAERMAIREKGKKSMIYMARPAGEGKPPSKPASVPQKAALPLSAHTPASPVITQPRTKRVKRKIIDSDSEDEFVGGREDASLAKRLKEDSNHETRALKYMNSAAAEALQELTGES